MAASVINRFRCTGDAGGYGSQFTQTFPFLVIELIFFSLNVVGWSALCRRKLGGARGFAQQRGSEGHQESAGGGVGIGSPESGKK